MKFSFNVEGFSINNKEGVLYTPWQDDLGDCVQAAGCTPGTVHEAMMLSLIAWCMHPAGFHVVNHISHRTVTAELPGGIKATGQWVFKNNDPDALNATPTRMTFLEQTGYDDISGINLEEFSYRGRKDLSWVAVAKAVEQTLHRQCTEEYWMIEARQYFIKAFTNIYKVYTSKD